MIHKIKYNQKDKMKKLLLAITLASLTSFAQVAPKNFISYVYGLNNPQSAFAIGIFNPANSGKNISLSFYELNIGFEANDITPYVVIGTSFATTLPTNGTCTQYKIINEDLTDVGEQVSTGSTAQSVAKIIGIPCITNGFIATGNLGTNTQTTTLNHFRLGEKWDMTTKPLVITPGKGYVVYIGESFLGTFGAGFRWSEQ
jgi:hypothetical protein